jgi:hypothetical protein
MALLAEKGENIKIVIGLNCVISWQVMGPSEIEKVILTGAALLGQSLREPPKLAQSFA